MKTKAQTNLIIITFLVMFLLLLGFWMMKPTNVYCFSFMSLNLVDPADGLMIGGIVDPGLNIAPRWDSVNRIDGKGTNRSLVEGLGYNFEGGSIEAFFKEFTFVQGVDSGDLSWAVISGLTAWASNSPVEFAKTETNVVLDIDIPGNNLEGNEIDIFGNPLPGITLGSTAIWGVESYVRLTNGFSPDASGLFPSTRIYSADVVIDNTHNGDSWSIADWQAVFTHELGHVLGLGDVDINTFFDNDAEINNPIPINQTGDVRVGLADQGYKTSQETEGILMRRESSYLLFLANDDLGGIQFLYPVKTPEPSTMLLLGSGLIGLAGYGRKKLLKK